MNEYPAENDEISLLDLLIVIAEHWLLLLAVPLLAAIAAFGFASIQPQSWRSAAVIALPQAEVSRHMQTLLPGEAASAGITVTEGGGADQTRIEVVRSDPQAAQEELSSLIGGLSTALDMERIVDPQDALASEIAALEAETAMRDDMIASLGAILETTDPDSPDGAQVYVEAAQALNDVLVARDAQRDTLARLRTNLAALPTTIVEDPPSTPQRVDSTSPLLVAAAVAIGTGFVLLLVIFMLRGLRNAAAAPENSEKIARIRRAFFLK